MNTIQIKNTIDSREVAEILEIPHYEILKKLEGTKNPDGTTKQVGIIPVLAGGNFPVSDYFIESTYKDVSGKENKCYLFTRLGCDFIANKFTGEKGIIFTALYVKRFREMEEECNGYKPKATSLGEVASFLKVTERVMKNQGSSPYEIANAFQMVCDQFGVNVPDNFVRRPKSYQLVLTCVE